MTFEGPQKQGKINAVFKTLSIQLSTFGEQATRFENRNKRCMIDQVPTFCKILVGPETTQKTLLQLYLAVKNKIIH